MIHKDDPFSVRQLDHVNIVCWGCDKVHMGFIRKEVPEAFVCTNCGTINDLVECGHCKMYHSTKLICAHDPAYRKGH